MIIAEVGQAHEGSLGIAHSYVDAVANIGVDAVKFQVHCASSESSGFEKFRINFSYEDKSRYDYWKRMEFTLDQWLGLKDHCEKLNVEFLATPFSVKAVELLESLNVGRYKIGSGDTDNLLLHKIVSETRKPVIISTGLSQLDEVDRAVNFYKSKSIDISVLQCTTSYPTDPENWGLNCIKEYKERYNIPVGFSDHSGQIYAGLAATALGAEIIEFHIVFDRKMFGPDSSSSLDLADAKLLVDGIHMLRTANANPVQKIHNKEYNQVFSRSISAKKDLPEGHVLHLSDLEITKPGGLGVSPEEYANLVGKVLTVSKEKSEFINYSDINCIK